jgi:hypothetical protein
VSSGYRSDIRANGSALLPWLGFPWLGQGVCLLIQVRSSPLDQDVVVRLISGWVYKPLICRDVLELNGNDFVVGPLSVGLSSSRTCAIVAAREASYESGLRALRPAPLRCERRQPTYRLRVGREPDLASERFRSQRKRVWWTFGRRA